MIFILIFAFNIKILAEGETIGSNTGKNGNKTTGEIKGSGGDGYLANITGIDKYSNAYQALDVIDSYVKNNGGTCKKSETKPANDN